MIKSKSIIKGAIITFIILLLIWSQWINITGQTIKGEIKTSENNYNSSEKLEEIKDVPRGHYLALQIKELNKMIEDKTRDTNN